MVDAAEHADPLGGEGGVQASDVWLKMALLMV
jgi:hypothetical protein